MALNWWEWGAMDCQGKGTRGTQNWCAFAGGGLATSSHPSAHGSGGLPHQLPEDHLLYPWKCQGILKKPI